MNSYDELYLDDAMKNLGESFDYAINICGFTADHYMGLFIASGISELFEKGNPKYIAGRSGTELTLDVLQKSGISPSDQEPQVTYDCSPEYWCGWSLAYFQWKSGRTFREIQSFISMEDIIKLYPTLHEASEDKFVDTLNLIFERTDRSSMLQRQRKRCGYSQRELAKRAGVNLRTLQQYELKSKDINKASVITVLSLANALGCTIETILE